MWGKEYPDGFKGATPDGETLRRVAAAAAAMNRVAEIRRTRISGTIANHARIVRDDWVVSLQGEPPHTAGAVPQALGSAFPPYETSRLRCPMPTTGEDLRGHQS
jgi:propionyl-CoA carboxylase alpha chain